VLPDGATLQGTGKVLQVFAGVGFAMTVQPADLLQQIGDRKEWVHRPAVALALARDPRTPPELAVRALDHVPVEAVRQLAKGAGTLPHVQAAARKKLLG
jgi:hypothetical protein